MSRVRAQSFVEDVTDSKKTAEEGALQRCLVYCRLRPTKPDEIRPKEGVYKLVDMGKKTVKVDGEKEYNYDGCFLPDCTQEEIFVTVGRPTVEHVLKGYCSAIMAYGQTGTGKSFTMSNMKAGQEGVIPRSAGYLFEKIAADPGRNYELSANFVQIYRDGLSDLMKPPEASPSGKDKVEIRFEKSSVLLIGATTVKIDSKEDFMNMYQEGDARRVVRATLMNPESSRGHTALVLYVKSSPKDDDGSGETINGKLTFIDLAGYERFSKTGLTDPIHIDEAKKINASLLSLGHVVSSLSRGGSHVPWRDSKLTMLLRDSIGGKSRTSIVITIGPSSEHLHETTNTLDFGNRAMDIEVKGTRDTNINYEKLAKNLQAMLDEKNEAISKLELAAATREAERLERERRHKADISRLRERHKEELSKLLVEGATQERIEALLKQHEVEEEVLQEQQEEEREFEEERHQEEDRAMVADIDQQHRIRAQSLKKDNLEYSTKLEDKQKELNAALEMIADLRKQAGLGEASTTDLAAQLAAKAETQSHKDPLALNGDDDAASPRSLAMAQSAIQFRELEEKLLNAEKEKDKALETAERVKKAHLKAVDQLKQTRAEINKAKEAGASVEAVQKLQGELEELREAKKNAANHRDELLEEIEKMTKKLHSVESNLEKTTIESRKERETRSAELDEMKRQISSITAEKDKVEEQLAAARKQMEDEAQQLQISLEEAKQEATKQKTKTEAKQERIDSLEAQLDQLEEEYRRKDREREEKLEDVSSTSTRRIAELEQEVASLKAKIEMLEKEKEAADRALAELEDRAKALESQLREAQETVEKLKSEQSRLQTALDESEVKAKKDVEDLQGQLDEASESASQNRRSLNQQLEELQTKFATERKAMEEKIAELEKGLTAGREHSAELETGVEASKQQCTALEGELSEVKAASDDLKKQIAALDEELAVARKSREDLEKDSSESTSKLEQRVQELESLVASKEGELTAALADLKETTEKLSATEAAVAELESKAASLSTDLETSRAAEGELREKVAELSDELGRVKEEGTAAAEREKGLTADTDELKLKVASLEGELKGVRGELTETKEAHEAKEGELTRRVEELEAVEKELSEKVKKQADELAEAREEGKGLEDRRDKLETDLQDERRKAEELSGKLEGLTREEAALREKVTSLEQHLEETRAKANDERQAFESKERDMASKHTEAERGLQEEKEGLERELREAEAKVQSIEERSAEQAAQIAELQKDKEEAGSQIQSLEEKLTQQTAEGEERAKRIAELEEEAVGLRESLVAKGEAIKGVEAELEAAREKIAGGEAAEGELAGKVAAGEERVAALSAELEKTKEDLSSAEEANVKAKAEIDELTAGLAAASAKEEDLLGKVRQAEEDGARRVQELEADLASARDQLEAAQKSSDEQAGDAAAKLAKAEETIATHESEIKELKERIAELEALVEELEHKLKEAESAHEAAATEWATKLDKAEAVRAEREEELQKEIERQAEEMSSKEDELLGRLEALEKEKQEAEDALQKDLEECRKQHDTLEDALNDAEESREALRLEYEAYRDEMEALKEDHEKEVKELENRLSESDEYQQQLVETMEKLEAELSGVKGEKTKAQQEAEELRSKHRDLRDKVEVERKNQEKEKERLKEEMEREIQRQQEKAMEAQGKFKYSSPLITRLISVAQMPLPPNAPELSTPIQYLQKFSAEEVKKVLRYRVFIVGSSRSGKSSVQQCLTKDSGFFKKAPDVVSPTLTAAYEEYTDKVEKPGGGGIGKRKAYQTTHYQLWDTPCDPRFISSLPEGALPVKGCAYIVCYVMNHEFHQESKKIEEILERIVGNCRQKLNGTKAAKIPVILMGTKRDFIPGAKDNSIVHGKIVEATKWFNDNQFCRKHFSLAGSYAVSCKEWTVQSEAGKGGPTNFHQVVRHLSNELHRRYPVTPPSMLEEEGGYGSGSGLDLNDWWAASASVSTEAERLKRAAHKAVLSLVTHLGRLKSRGCWLMGVQEYGALLKQHIPDDVQQKRPELGTEITNALVDRGFLMPFHDPAFKDDKLQEVMVIAPGIITSLISCILLPYIYLSQVDSYSVEKPGHLKNLITKADFFIEKVWRPEWDAMFDGCVSTSPAALLLQRMGHAFGGDLPLILTFLSNLNLCFQLRSDGAEGSKTFFFPSLCLRALSPELESTFLAMFKKDGGFEAATLRCGPICFAHQAAIQRDLYLAGNSCELWTDGVAIEVKGKWACVKFNRKSISVFSSKTGPVEEIRKLVEGPLACSDIPFDWKNGMDLEGLPRLPPSTDQMVQQCPSFADLISEIPVADLRGRLFPRTLDEELMPKRRGAPAPASSKRPQGRGRVADRIAEFEDGGATTPGSRSRRSSGASLTSTLSSQAQATPSQRSGN